MIYAPIAPTFEAFRERARALLAASVPPDEVAWDDGTGQLGLFAPSTKIPDPAPLDSPQRRVPAVFVAEAELAAIHSDPTRWSLLYRIAHRLTTGEARLLEAAGDADVTHLRKLVSAVRRDEHRMHAFLRFRPVRSSADDLVAWYEPEFDILQLAAPFFVRRFASLRWVIVTPPRSAIWDGRELRFDEGRRREGAPEDDELDELFRAYYAAVFNPARANGSLFEHHVPRRFRAEMPETKDVATLLRAAPVRTRELTTRITSASQPWIPPEADIAGLAHAAQSCAACPIGANATQAVFGEGPLDARVVLVGEQPGDQEDQIGRPFVGPAGEILDRALVDANLPRAGLYLTNAVKHFKWEPRGKRRLHSRPNPVEVHACRGWLDAELALVKPRVVVCLGSTAARALHGKTFRVSEHRGRALDGAPWAQWIVATHHPAAILRAGPTDAVAMYDELARDLVLAAGLR